MGTAAGRTKKPKGQSPLVRAEAVPVGAWGVGYPHGERVLGAPEPPAHPERPRKALTLGASLLPIGLGIVGIGPSDLGMGLTLAALVVLIYGVHSFGRLGPI